VPIPTRFESSLISLTKKSDNLLILSLTLQLQLPFDDQTLRNLKSGDILWFESPDRPTGVNLLQLIESALAPSIARLSVGLRLPNLREAFYEPYIPEVIKNVRVGVAGQTIDISPFAARAISTMPPSRSITRAEVLNLLTTEATNSDYIVALSDSSHHYCDLPVAIALLTTALEVSAYEYLGKHHLGKKGDPERFNPKAYLDSSVPTVASGMSFRSIDPKSYEACEELWGTRHEILHLGKFQVRTFDSATTGKSGPAKLRQFVGEDYEAFRVGVINAIGWMKSI
jgi:hypothetical protein